MSDRDKLFYVDVATWGIQVMSQRRKRTHPLLPGRVGLARRCQRRCAGCLRHLLWARVGHRLARHETPRVAISSKNGTPHRFHSFEPPKSNVFDFLIRQPHVHLDHRWSGAMEMKRTSLSWHRQTDKRKKRARNNNARDLCNWLAAVRCVVSCAQGQTTPHAPDARTIRSFARQRSTARVFRAT
jgi:hypothetical protein